MLTIDEVEHANSDRPATYTAHAATPRSAPAPLIARSAHRAGTDRRPNLLTLGIAAGLLLSAPGPTHVATVEPTHSHTASTSFPVIDVAAPFFWDHQRNDRVGGRAYRFDDVPRPAARTCRPGTTSPTSSAATASKSTSTTPPPPKGPNRRWPRARTLPGTSPPLSSARPAASPDQESYPPGPDPPPTTFDGSSGGLLYALADLDLLTPGRLAGELRVAATGSIYTQRRHTRVRHVDAKLAAARLAHPDVFFAPHIPPNSSATHHRRLRPRPTHRRSHHRRLAQHRWLRARRPPRRQPPRHPRPRRRRRHPPSPRLALRTHKTPATCTVAEAVASTALPIAGPYNPHANQVAVTPKNATCTLRGLRAVTVREDLGGSPVQVTHRSGESR